MPVRPHAAVAATWALVLVPAGGVAGAAEPGGAAVPRGAGGAGGAEYGVPLKGAQAPRATRFSVTPHTLAAGARPRIVVRIDQPGGGRVSARVVFWPDRGRGGRVVRLPLGRVRVGRTLRLRWPARLGLAPGRYTVRLHATDQGGMPLERRRRTPGRVALTVRPKPKPKPKPKPAPVPAAGATFFPVRGAHRIGDGFGAPRVGYGHQGVDIAAAQGTPVVSPTAGSIRFTDYQASAAGEYVVERLADGRDVFFAHCVRGSTVVRPGQPVAAGARICDVGTTGRSSGPHLHFELWPAGWRDVKGALPVDPLPQLRAWG